MSTSSPSPLSSSSSLPTSAFPAPVPVPSGVGPFGPLRVRGGGAHRLRRMLRRQRRAAAAGLALAGAALATTGLSSADGRAAATPDAPPGAGRSSVRLVSAPVRIADPETVRLLRPGDRVDVIAVGDAGDDARVVARGARVAKVPHAAAGPGGHAAGGGGEAGSGALVVLSVERSTATTLLGAGASGRLAVAVSDAN
ncbi:RcpC/CpaB family pilus assembly protein [Streptomyces griseus]|uniref:RcpC/CpaB family pilus assembly protein n=1 Tax=Streptomyces griseus TaxID=1911 RepID=UPI00341A63F1